MLLLLAVVAAGGCAPSTGPGAQSAEQQSDSQYSLAAEYYKKGQYRLALDGARKAIELNDENRDALFLASTIHLLFCSGIEVMKSSDCNLGEAEKFARLSLKVDDKFREGRNTLGAILIEERKYDEAIKTLEPLVNDPAYESIHLAWGNLGWAQIQAGRIDAGIVSLEKAIALMPKFCVGFYRLGIAYEKKKDYPSAEASLTRAVTVEHPSCQNLQDAWWARGRVRMSQGKKDDARADYAKCREISAETQTGKTCIQGMNTIPAPEQPQP